MYTGSSNVIQNQNADMGDILMRFIAVKKMSEFMLLCDLCGFKEEFPPDVFVKMFSERLRRVCPSVAIAEADAESLNKFLDVIWAVLLGSSMLHKAVSSKQFIITCGRWMSRGYIRKDKTMFLKLAKILGYVASRLMHV